MTKPHYTTLQYEALLVFRGVTVTPKVWEFLDWATKTCPELIMWPEEAEKVSGIERTFYLKQPIVFGVLKENDYGLICVPGAPVKYLRQDSAGVFRHGETDLQTARKWWKHKLTTANKNKP